MRALIDDAPGITELNVSLALPLAWPGYRPVRESLLARGVRLRDTLELQPDPSLRPRDVVVAQAGACGPHGGCCICRTGLGPLLSPIRLAFHLRVT